MSPPAPCLHLCVQAYKAGFRLKQLALHVQAFLPLLGADRTLRGLPGRIIMISSGAALLSNPFMAAYAASKRGLEAFSSSLRRELLLYGIDVTVIGERPLRNTYTSVGHLRPSLCTLFATWCPTGRPIPGSSDHPGQPDCDQHSLHSTVLRWLLCCRAGPCEVTGARGAYAPHAHKWLAS